MHDTTKLRGQRRGGGCALMPIRAGSLRSNRWEPTPLVQAIEAEWSVARPHREAQSSRASRLISCRLHSLRPLASALQPRTSGKFTAHEKKFWGEVYAGSLGRKPEMDLQPRTLGWKVSDGRPVGEDSGRQLNPRPGSLMSPQLWSPRTRALDILGLLPCCHPVPFSPISSWPWALSPGTARPTSKLCKVLFQHTRR